MLTFPARSNTPLAPDSLGDDPAVMRQWLIETALLWARWGQIPLLALLSLFLRPHPWPLPLLPALALVLGNAALTRVWWRGPSPARLVGIRRGATALEWVGLLALVGLWHADPASALPGVLASLILTAGARRGVVGVSAAAAGVALAVAALTGWQGLALGLLAPRAMVAHLGGWLALLAPIAGTVGALTWAEGVAWHREAARDRRERAALRRYTSGLSPRQWEVLLLLARPALTYEAIAARLHLEPESVREYVKRIAAKWAVSGGRAAVVAEARARGLLDLPDDAPPGAA